MSPKTERNTLICAKNDPKKAEENRRFRVQFKTDAENDYFTRDKESGEFKLLCNGEKIDFVMNLWNGYANLNSDLPKSAKPGDIFKFESFVEDVSRIEPFTEEFYVEVREKRKRNNKPTNGKRKKPSSDDPGNNSKGENMLSLPNVIEVEKREWDQHDFDEYSALKVEDAGDGSYDYFVNIDNSNLLYEIKNISGSDAQLYINRFKYAVVLIALSILKDYQNDDLKIDDKDLDILKMIGQISRSVSPMLLPMIQFLGDLELEDL